MGIFGNLALDTDVNEVTEDRLGGGSRTIDQSILTDATIELAYAITSKGGAKGVSLVLKLDDGREHRETIYMTNKQGQPFYTKDGEKYPMPGFVTVDNLALLTCDKSITAIDAEKKMVKLYDWELKKEVPTEIDALTELMGKRVTVGILVKIVNKTENDGTGNYKPTNEKRTERTINALFHSGLGVTVVEAKAGKREPEFKPKWEEKYQGEVLDFFKPVDGAPAAGAPTGGLGGGTTQGTTSLNLV